MQFCQLSQIPLASVVIKRLIVNCGITCKRTCKDDTVRRESTTQRRYILHHWIEYALLSVFQVDGLVIPILDILITQYISCGECFQTFCNPKRYMHAHLNSLITDNLFLIPGEFMTVVNLEDEVFTKILSIMGKPRCLHCLQRKQFATALNTLFWHHKTIKKLAYLPFLFSSPIQQFFSSVLCLKVPKFWYYLLRCISNFI